LSETSAERRSLDCLSHLFLDPHLITIRAGLKLNGLNNYVV